MSFFKEIAGHRARVGELERDLSQGNIAHAYLFAGPENIGKYTVAKLFANVLQCPNGFCKECAVCSEIEKGYHGDTIELADNGESIKIKEIREIIDKVNLSKQAKYKVVLIKNIERAGLDASNALLKVLEDPPDNVIFLLTASRIKEILPTIISRVRLMKFGKLKREELVEFLRKIDPLQEETIVNEAVDMAEGKTGKALVFLRDSELLLEHKEMYKRLEKFIRKPDFLAQMAYVNDLIKTSGEEEDKSIIFDFLNMLISIGRNELLTAIKSGTAGMEAIVKRSVAIIKGAERARILLKNNINTKLLLENLLLSLT
jgi:DNA polymerase III subunit gamma/tau